MMLLPGSVAWADIQGPTPTDRHITKAVTLLLNRDHLLQRPLDDEISQRGFKAFLETLDPAKIYFYQSDIDSFQPYAKELDDMARRGNVDFAYRAFDTLMKRIDERVALVDEFLAAKHDFTFKETMIKKREDMRYPRDAAEARERWRKRIKYDLLDLKSDGVEGDEAIQQLKDRYHGFSIRMHQITGEDLLEMYLSALTTALDPHTTYMSPDSHDAFLIAMRLGLEGIGASLQWQDGYTVVHQIIRGGAAHKDGRLKAGDKILAVAQGDGPFVDIKNKRLTDVVKIIRGKPGTVVRLKVVSKPKKKEKDKDDEDASAGSLDMRDFKLIEESAPLDPEETETKEETATSTEPRVIEIVRSKIELKDSEAQYRIFESIRKVDGRTRKIGVIELPSFYMDMEAAQRHDPDFRSTTRDVLRILDKFKTKGINAVVLDLRFNSGGALTEAISLTGLFIDQGPIVQVKGAGGYTRAYPDPNPGVAWAGPLVVLTSKFSASASEIFAGAIQDYHRGLIVGDPTTHGKGTVQSMLDISDQLFRIPNPPKLGALKVTMQQYYRPNGDSTQLKGVLADVSLPSITSHLDVGESDLDYPITFDHIAPADYQPLDLVNKPICDRLRALSAQRCKDSKEFQRAIRRIAEFDKWKDKKSISLNEEEFLAQYAALKADKEVKERLGDPNRPSLQRNYYLDEALSITLDYLQLLGQSTGQLTHAE
ncbi:MAG: carboxy terminal-processing peptidase [Pirellulales bacterium]|nr:carboxy terminal-processing peptidase [Pirellulales bacterium]